jgi:nitroreductase
MREFTSETIELINKRSSCRNFDNREVSDKLLKEVIEAGLKTPSAGNMQLTSIVKITDKKMKKRLSELSFGQKYVEKAPVNLLVCIDYNRMTRMSEMELTPLEGKDEFLEFWMSMLDAGIMAQNLCLASESTGLKSIYIGNVISHLGELKKMFNLPKHVVPVVLICLGHPKSDKRPTRKQTYEMAVHDEMYHQPSDDKIRENFNTLYKNWKITASEEMLESFEEQCNRVEGSDFAKKAMDQIKENGSTLNMYQYFQGIFYQKPEDIMNNKDYRDFMKEQGFGWLDF